MTDRILQDSLISLADESRAANAYKIANDYRDRLDKMVSVIVGCMSANEFRSVPDHDIVAYAQDLLLSIDLAVEKTIDFAVEKHGKP